MRKYLKPDVVFLTVAGPDNGGTIAWAQRLKLFWQRFIRPEKIMGSLLRKETITEHAVGIAHLAAPDHRENLLKHIFESTVFNKPATVLRGGRPKGFSPYEAICCFA